MSAGAGGGLAHRSVAILCGLSCLLMIAFGAGGWEFRRAVVGNGAAAPTGMTDGARAMQATAGQAIVGQSGDGTRTQVLGFWARGAVLVLGVDGPPKGSGTPRLAFGPPQPNPVRAGTRLAIALPEPGDVRLDVFDLQGREVANLVDAHMGAGTHSVHWNAAVSPGVYLARLVVDGRSVAERRLVVVR